MSAPIYESVTKFSVGQFRIRIWREEDSPGEITDSDFLHRAQQCIDHIVHENHDYTHREILEIFGEMAKVNAVEVTDSDNRASLRYNNWP